MSFGTELINVMEGGAGIEPLNNRQLPPLLPSEARDNADRFEQMLQHVFDHGGGYVYFPPGRYVIGRPSPSGVVRPTRLQPLLEQEFDADLVVPAPVTLKFAPGAVLIPAGYTEADQLGAPYVRRPVAGLPASEAFKVRLAIRGGIEALVHPIFDTFMEANRDLLPTTAAGRILLYGEAVRVLYPEWWGAVPLEDNGTSLEEEMPTGRPLADIIRTTSALQAAIDAGFNTRVRLGALPRPSIPVVLLNDYAIHRPLRVGATVDQSQGLPFDGDPPFNGDGMILRGESGAATRRFGAAMIKTARNFTTTPDDPVASPEVSSMLVLRTGCGNTVENVIFDGNESADRCVTITLVANTFSHHNGFTDCEFRNARLELVRVGGEVPPVVLDPSTRKRIARSRSAFFSAQQDLSNLRFERCHFDTGADSVERVVNTLLDLVGRQASGTLGLNPMFTKQPTPPGLWRIGLVFRATQAMGVELDGCSFVGPASPMILALGGRLALQRCTFRTDVLPLVYGVTQVVSVPMLGTPPTEDLEGVRLRWWNGTDLYLGVGFTESIGADGGPETDVTTTITAQIIESRSRQFMTTFPLEERLRAPGGWALGTVTLMHLRHRNSFDDGADRPAIYWGGPRLQNNVLVLHGCVFDPRVSTDVSRVGGSVYLDSPGGAPVVDLGARRIDRRAVLTTQPFVIPTGFMRLGGATNTRIGG